MNKSNYSEALNNLVRLYYADKEKYESRDYLEAQVRIDFIDKIWKILGWNVSNDGLNYDMREVVVESNINNKRVDYEFRLNSKATFLVEAKKPIENLDKKDNIFQAKSYAFSSIIPFVFVTNFQRIKLYLINSKPNYNQVNEDLIWEWDIEQSVEGLEFLWQNFSKSEVEKGSLQKLYRLYVKTSKSLGLEFLYPESSSLLDEEFVKDTNIWRMQLAEAIYINNKSMPSKDLSIRTQYLLNRLIFTRILEDNNIIKDSMSKLIEACKRKDEPFLNQLFQHFRKLDKEFNSNLFVNEYEITNIDPGKLYSVIEKLYYPNSIYNFSVMPIDILGKVFEEFLTLDLEYEGKKIKLSFNTTFRKKEGIYYTPPFLVNNLVNDIIKKQNINFVKGIFPRIIDITCGSGVFLVQSFKLIIKISEEQLNSSSTSLETIEELKNDGLIVFSDKQRKYILTTKSRNMILSKSIFGVDIDERAVELTKLNLFIAMVTEGEKLRDSTVSPILPSMKENIEHGNSIVEDSFLNDISNHEITDQLRIIKKALPHNFKSKYDVVLGNPPYIEQKLLKQEFPHEMISYINNRYDSIKHGNYDLSIVFLYRAFSLLDENGILGFVMNQQFLHRDYGKKLREYLVERKAIEKIVNFEDIQLFRGATTYITLLTLSKKITDKVKAINVKELQQWKNSNNPKFTEIDVDILKKSGRWKVNSDNFYRVFESISYIPLKDIKPDVFVGTQTDADEVFLLKFIRPFDSKYGLYYSNLLDKEIKLEFGIMKKAAKGSRTIHRYSIEEQLALIFPYIYNYKNNKRVVETMSEESIKTSFPLTWKYLNNSVIKSKLLSRKKIKTSQKKWYEFTTPKNLNKMDQPKMLLPAMIDGGRFYCDSIGEYSFIGSGLGGGGGFGLVLKPDSKFTLRALCAIFNSTFFNFYIKENESPFNASFYGIGKNNILEFPIPFDINKDAIELLDKYSFDMDKLISKKTEHIGTAQEKVAFEKTLDILVNSIDEIVYEAYKVPENIRTDLNKKYKTKLY